MDLKTWASAMLGRKGGKTKFRSEAALATYLREHPKADASKHSVEKAASSESSTKADEASKRASDPRLSTKEAISAHEQAARAHSDAAFMARASGDHERAAAHSQQADKHDAERRAWMAARVEAIARNRARRAQLAGVLVAS